MLRLYVAANLPEAHLVCAALRRARIEAEVFNEYAPGAAGELPLTEAAPEVWIRHETDLARAREVIAGYERTRRAAGSRRCPDCGEDSPATFDVCWRCGAPLADG